jgi:hypothetical protein
MQILRVNNRNKTQITSLLKYEVNKPRLKNKTDFFQQYFLQNLHQQAQEWISWLQ